MKKNTFISIHKNQNDWWLNTKGKIIIEIVKQLFSSKKIHILDIASGTGFIANKFSNEGYKNITVSDKSLTALKILKLKFKKILKINLPNNLSVQKTYDCILLLDVLEHIDNDYKSLRNISKLLKKNGKIIITVPAFEFLWSKKDNRVEHKRRYTKKSLQRLINDSKLQAKYISYYNFFLFLPALLYSLTNKKSEIIPRYNYLQNLIFTRIFEIEIPIIKKRMIFPFGVSLIAIISNEK